MHACRVIEQLLCLHSIVYNPYLTMTSILNDFFSCLRIIFKVLRLLDRIVPIDKPYTGALIYFVVLPKCK